MKQLFTYLILAISFNFLACGSSPKYDNLTILNPRKTYTYRAILLTPSGETLSDDRIMLRPAGRPWSGQPDRQTEVLCEMNYSEEDVRKLSPLSKTSVGREWTRCDMTGGIENRKEFWMHPVRENQYFKTEVAPFPQVKFPISKEKTWESTVTIYSGWGIFNGSKTESQYRQIGQALRDYPFQKALSFWKYQAVGANTRVGTSELAYCFHPEYGFTEMSYTFYDGEKLLLTLEGVEQNKPAPVDAQPSGE
jgi:hypothetical protein